jgi:cytochrome c-type biogenesis protein CcmH/NrfG
MRRDTLAFTIAGVVFGFVLGYMAAGWGGMPQPAPVGTTAAPAGQAAAPAEAPATRPTPDPDELRAMESLAARQPNDAGVRTELGNVYMDAQRWDDAIRWYGEALKITPDNPDVRTDLGACYVHSGRPAQGLEQFDAVLKKNPGHRNALFNRGVALLNMGRQTDAADTWEELLKRHPDDPQLARLRGRILDIRAAGGAAQGAAKGR